MKAKKYFEVKFHTYMKENTGGNVTVRSKTIGRTLKIFLA
jgi:hypothetical protein